MRATTLDKLYFNSNQNLLKECLNTFLENVEYCLANKKKEDALIDDILRNDIPINATLYEVYSKNLRKAVDKVFYEDNGNGLSDCLRANVNRFAAYKAYHATQQVREQIAEDGDMDRARKVLHAFNRYQAAEYNTTVSRCRTAKQFEEFSAADNMRLFPNLRWLPSRSANPREQHMLFYNRVWAKDDPFWAQNQPGNLWNCKCDWEETADPVTDGNPTAPVRHDGLEGNPAQTGEVFTDNCAYVKNSGQNRRERDKVEIKCENLNKLQTVQIAKEALKGKTTECTIQGKKYEVEFIGRGIDHYARDIFGEKNIFWIKNEILPKIQEYIKNATCAGKKKSDTEHNTNKETLKLKKQTSYFYYFPITLPNGKEVWLHLGMYNEKKVGKEGKMYLYTVTPKAPKNMEDL